MGSELPSRAPNLVGFALCMAIQHGKVSSWGVGFVGLGSKV